MILDESKVECVAHAGSGRAHNRIIYIKKNIRRSSAVNFGVLLTSWGMVGDLKAPMRFAETVQVEMV